LPGGWIGCRFVGSRERRNARSFHRLRRDQPEAHRERVSPGPIYRDSHLLRFREQKTNGDDDLKFPMFDGCHRIHLADVWGEPEPCARQLGAVPHPRVACVRTVNGWERCPAASPIGRTNC
jgi:hypothetical protein